MNQERGSTLIETILVIAITVLLFGALFTLYDWHNRIYVYEQAAVRTSGSARQVMQAIEESALQGYRVVSSHVFGANTRTTGTNAVVIQIPAINASGGIVASTYDYVAFTQSGTSLLMDFDAAATSNRKDLTKTLSDTVSTFTVTYDNADYSLVKKITADLTVSLQAKNQTLQDHLIQDIILRNY